MKFKSFLAEMAKLQGYSLVPGSVEVGPTRFLKKVGVVIPDKGPLFDPVSDPASLKPKQRQTLFTQKHMNYRVVHNETGLETKLQTTVEFAPSGPSKDGSVRHSLNVVTKPRNNVSKWSQGEYESMKLGLPFKQFFQDALHGHFQTHNTGDYDSHVWGITEGEDSKGGAGYSSNRSKAERFGKAASEAGYDFDIPTKASNYFTIKPPKA